ncbi:inhibitor of growth protein 5-like [Sinocyclocheilus rhinocerous]|uniref:inhibitor of growth protein 5-like n=1 Tax=Sinocyclocheilus rhinocerous TaxID=307959 RepID=UPI0007B7DC1C|nr:PREDICTED: inhibitor of growth protein 5-like [Sinocyclocheilus rhinocerous]
MATAIYLEHYLDSIENLPCELQRNFTLMRELDNRAEEKKCEIDKLAEEYIKNVRNLAPDQRVEHLQKIQNGFSKCKEYSDDKVQLAMQTYEMFLYFRSPEFSESILPVHPSDVLDMPVDPNEPTYCLCHQVSYGEMIGCDNPDCPVEWFHFACVDLTTKPKGKWFCPRCTQDRKKK